MRLNESKEKEKTLLMTIARERSKLNIFFVDFQDRDEQRRLEMKHRKEEDDLYRKFARQREEEDRRMRDEIRVSYITNIFRKIYLKNVHIFKETFFLLLTRYLTTPQSNICRKHQTVCNGRNLLSKKRQPSKSLLIAK